MVNMLSRAWFGDAVAELEEEVLEDYFALERVHRFCAVREFQENEYVGGTLRIGKMLQGDDRASSSREDILKRERQNRTFFLLSICCLNHNSYSLKKSLH